jgi:tetratricopeptide (TPR) repeat protein
VVLNTRPVLADIAARTANRRAAAGDLAGAVANWERAIELWPPEPAYRLSLAWFWLQSAQHAGGNAVFHLSQAEAHLLAARDQRPGDFRTWAALGELYGVWGNAHDARRLGDAHRAFARAATLAPHHATLYTAWGMVDLAGGRCGAAADRFRRAVALDETDGYAFLHLGDAEFARGRVPEALGAYRQAVRWEPALASAHLGLARCYWKVGRAEAAARALERVLALDPGNPGAWALRRVIEDR